MESTSGLDRGWNFATNWTVSAGSLGNSVTVESSSSPIDDDDAALGSAPKSPLVLSPPTSPAPGPCEITINFLQKYEVRQVYVRSTSRVYEIYYSPKQQGDDDYLCTVRCGIAAKVQAPDLSCTGESSSTCPRGSSEGLGEERCKDDNSSSNDDEWVEVKAPNSPAVTDSSTSLLLKNYKNSDFYEATAEISDAEACVSLTIRLLSVQSVGCVYVDEVYVFVDRVDLNSERQESKEENSAGSSLLTMLVPSLLQLSKSKGATLLSEIGSSDSNSHWKQTRTGIEVTEQDKPSRESESTSFAKVNEQGVKSEVSNAKPVHPVVEPAHQISQNAYMEKMPDASYSRIETVLEQLVSRVSRMEDLFMRFEENMLKPISKIDARLQHVEQQLDALNERTLDTRDRSCKRFVAPEYSLSDSINSLCGNESEYHDQGELESDKKDISDKLSAPREDDKFCSGSSGRMLPCLTVTAPDFSQGDDEEEEKCVVETEEVVDSPKVKRKGVSIDDALASALAGFLSLAVRAPEFSNEDEDSEGNASPRVHLDAATDSSVCLNADDEVKLYKNPSPGNVNNEDPLEKIDREIIDPREPSKEENSDEARDVMDDSAKPVIRSISSHHRVFENEDGETSTETSSVPVPDGCEASDSLFQTQMVRRFHHVEELVNSTCTASEVPEEDLKENVLHDMFAALYQPACVLDLATPIDVKFEPQENGTSKSVLEVLLGISPESDIAIPSDEGTVEASSSRDHTNFIEVDGANQSEPAADSCFTVDTEYYSLQDVLVDPDSEKLQDDRNQASLEESLI